MAPAKVVSAEVSTAAKGGAPQRSIASFFGPRIGPSAASKKTRETLRIPSEGGATHLQSSPAKQVHVGSVKKNHSSENENSQTRSASTSPDSTGGRNGGTGTKGKDWVSTPSPCEPAKSTTKTFGRSDRITLKSGVVAPVLFSSIDHPPERSTMSETAEIGPNPESLIGRGLKVFWPLDKVWYSGRVKSYDKALASHVVRYDDGEEESIVLEKEKVQWSDDAAEQRLQRLESTGITKRTRDRSNKESSDPFLKRKKVETDDEELEDSLLNELMDDGDDEVQFGVSKRDKRARVEVVVEDSPAKVLTVSADVYDEIDIALHEQGEEVMVRKRLRKKGAERASEKNQVVEEIDLMDMEEEVLKAGTLQRAATSARRLQLGDADEQTEKPLSTKRNEKLKAGSVDEIFTPASADSNSEAEPILSRKAASKFNSGDGKASLGAIKSQAKDFFSRLGVKSSQIAPGSLASLSVKTLSSASKDDSFESPNAIEADKLANGDLHSTLLREAADRFGGRVEEKFKFLGKGRKDGSSRCPSDPQFDPRTVLLPQDFLKGLTGGQRQWWEFKAKHMDKVLLFKMGKFYELFEMDAHIGAQELDLQYMKGDQPHCGFPEKLYSDCAAKLARKGFRVLVVEQTETPDQLEQRKRETGTKDKVVRREVCAVLTKGTIVDGEMLVTCPDAAYLMSITEMMLGSEHLATPDNAATIGICVVDTSTSHVMLGQFIDDAARTRLRSVLSELRPVELIKPRGVLMEATERAIKDHTRQPLINVLAPRDEFWDAKKSLKEILEIYASFNSTAKTSSGKATKKNLTQTISEQLEILPKAVRLVVHAGCQGEAALSAIGGCIFYLRGALLDQTVLRLGRIDLLPGSDPFSRIDRLAAESEQIGPNEGPEVGHKVTKINGEVPGVQLEPYMLMDSAALENLEIIENNRDGGTSGTLLAHLDTCVTPYGRRLLKKWLVRPLLRVEPILQRQLALLDLKDVAADAAANFRKELKSQSDMERLLARLHACSGGSGRNAENVVLYEDAAKKQLQEFMGALRGCRALLQAMKSFESCLSELTSSRLRELVTPGLGVPDMTSIIEHFETAFDREEAERTGRIVPHEGVDESYDEANSAAETASQNLAEYLLKQRKKFGNSSEIKYVTVGKEQYQMEIPEKFHSKVPSSYEMRSSRKGFQRYWTPEIKEHLQDLASGEQKREVALRGILQGLVKRFCEDYSKWLALVKSVAEVDVLISLSEATLHSAPTCRPTFVTEDSSSDIYTQKITAKGIQHPTVCINLAGGGTFVPNDVALGGMGPPFMLLSGPNMGGKSTLIRQVCLAVVLAQVGANVTADQFELSLVDRVFVRMGAKDHIMAGQSTFLVELSETATMLRSATCRSLVALDELGRGTSTSDGQAIAHSVLQYLAHNVGCRGIFSTHYHRLATHFSSDSKVGLHHMSCKVDTGVDGLEEVIFLYKLAEGACPKSYGVNVARLAGIPESVLHRAAHRAAELELLWGKIAGSKPQQEPKELQSIAGDNSIDDVVSGSEIESKMIEEVLSFMNSIPSDLASDVSQNSLLRVWHEAKQILQTNECREESLYAE